MSRFTTAGATKMFSWIASLQKYQIDDSDCISRRTGNSPNPAPGDRPPPVSPSSDLQLQLQPLSEPGPFWRQRHTVFYWWEVWVRYGNQPSGHREASQQVGSSPTPSLPPSGVLRSVLQLRNFQVKFVFIFSRPSTPSFYLFEGGWVRLREPAQQLSRSQTANLFQSQTPPFSVPTS